jgi:hypothetical protein
MDNQQTKPLNTLEETNLILKLIKILTKEELVVLEGLLAKARKNSTETKMEKGI